MLNFSKTWLKKTKKTYSCMTLLFFLSLALSFCVSLSVWTSPIYLSHSNSPSIFSSLKQVGFLYPPPHLPRCVSRRFIHFSLSIFSLLYFSYLFFLSIYLFLSSYQWLLFSISFLISYFFLNPSNLSLSLLLFSFSYLYLVFFSFFPWMCVCTSFFFSFFLSFFVPMTFILNIIFLS